jgi:hypothetical protein
MFSDWEQEAEYEAKQQWDWDPTHRGFRGSFPTAAQDFEVPYQEPDPEPEDDFDEDLIGPIDEDEEDPWDLI